LILRIGGALLKSRDLRLEPFNDGQGSRIFLGRRRQAAAGQVAALDVMPRSRKWSRIAARCAVPPRSRSTARSPPRDLKKTSQARDG
jgi:hypothetical protein